MDPGPRCPDLPKLTQMEEILISPIHAFLQVWQICSGQYKYAGHCVNFARENYTLNQKVPALLDNCDIMIVHWAGTAPDGETQLFEDFHVCRAVVDTWLTYPLHNHPTFISRQCQIDAEALASLPENGLVNDQL
ncbi:hypothetical protein JAAARDRAFT_135895 [Jaapia argillacea MUCL 33604]|uniref:DUF6570 domain-containing protein n=1 Tax=Jaapia argillacea MUCL 33604 TaxID=933084 RepID=A0A067PHD2_9AGAM|nr:hypothetical protein JAAARDRAFT_135895 [Jaapia argillacea MUCL 33604]